MPTVIKSAQLIVDPSIPPIARGIVIVEGRSILQAGPAEAIKIPPDSIVVDRSDDTVLPGLVDSHAHVTSNTKYPMVLMDQFQLDLATAVLRGSMSLRSDLGSGVTTMRLVGDRGDVERRFQQTIDRGEIPGPRLVICIRALRPSHGTAKFLAHTVDGPQALRSAVREIYCMGAQCIKLFVSNVQNGEAFEDYLRGDLTEAPAYSKEELDAAIGEAHNLGIKVAGHGIGGPSMRWAIEAGIDSIEHGNLIREEDIELFVRHGTFLSDPNLQLFFDEETGFETFSTWTLDWWREKVTVARERTARLIPEAIKAGVKLCLGTDSTHGALWREAKHLVGLGVSTKEALLAVTKNGAELLGMSDTIGTLEPGKMADIISVRGDPLKDITALHQVGLVMKEGRAYTHLL